MPDQFLRTQLLFGEEAMGILKKSRVAVFGIGGVGGYVVEALVRSGVGTLDLVDDDKVSLTNLNRQIIATRATIGRYKVDAAQERACDINPDCVINKHKTFYLPETAEQFDFSEYDYVVDAIDTVKGKLQLVLQAQESGTPVISCMGTGNKLDPSRLEVTDLYKTEMDPIARIMRRELKKRGIRRLKVVYSKEPPIKPINDCSAGCRMKGTDPQEKPGACTGRRPVPGSTAFVPPAAGLIIAAEVVKDLTREAAERARQE